MTGATREATAALAERFRRGGFSKDAYRILGKTGLTVSALGFGAYRVEDHSPEHREALARALSRGCNLIDTSTNYTDGGSETCIGEILQERIGSGEVRREETVVVSKIGYVQGENLKLAREREKAGDPFPEMVKVSPGCWHCIHPRFLEDQLGRSLARLKLARLDVCLLHNPEYFLEDAGRKGVTGDPEASRREFYARIRAAFVRLEEEVKRGRIAWYGVSSNTFGMPAAERDATSLGRMLEEAEQAARESGLAPADHHFAVAQLPMNLFEHFPATVKKEGPSADRTVLELAAEHSVGVLVNRPLNAFSHGGLIRLADFRTKPPELSRAEALEKVADLEEEFAREIGAHLRGGPDRPAPGSIFAWSRQLAGLAGKVEGYEHWQAIQEQQIQPRLFHAVSYLRSAVPEERSEAFGGWLERYLPALGELLSSFRAEGAARSQERSDRIASGIDPLLPAAVRAQDLSRKALHVAASAMGVTCVLNGMRHPLYVDDSMEVLKWDRLPESALPLGRL
jgi:uncharacterized protein